MTTTGPEPDWYFDPDGGENERYWNGVVWTDHRRSRRPTVNQPPESFSHPADIEDPISASPTTQTLEAALPSESTELRLGGWAEVVGGDKWGFIGWVGKIVTIGSDTVSLNFTGISGAFDFRRNHVVPASTEDQPDGRLTPKSSRPGSFSHPADIEDPSESTELRLGDWAEVVGGNRLLIGRVGKIVAIDSNGVGLKWKGSWWKRYFRRNHVVHASTEDQPDGRLTPKSSRPDPAAGPAPTMHSLWSSKTATAHTFPQPPTWARDQVPKVKRFWAGLPTMGRLAVVAAPIVVILIAIIVASASSGTSSGNSASYLAGAESGARVEQTYRDLGHPQGSSDEDIERTCGSMAGAPADIGYDVHWDGGVIPLSEFDADDYKRGCVDGSLKARG